MMLIAAGVVLIAIAIALRLHAAKREREVEMSQEWVKEQRKRRWK